MSYMQPWSKLHWSRKDLFSEDNEIPLEMSSGRDENIFLNATLKQKSWRKEKAEDN